MIDGVEDCSERNTLFNDIFTATNIAFCLCTVIFGYIGDRFGMFIGKRVLKHGCLGPRFFGIWTGSGIFRGLPQKL